MTQYLAGKRVTFRQCRVESCSNTKESTRSCLNDFAGTCIYGGYFRGYGNPFYPVFDLGLPAWSDLDIVAFVEDAPNKRPSDDTTFHVLPVTARFVHIK